jgi:hypothetical protein
VDRQISFGTGEDYHGTHRFIGLGNMGGGMAANLAKAGHDVRAFDLSAEDALERAKAAGCLTVDSAAAAAEGAEAIVTMLPAGKHVEQVYADAVFGTAAPGTLLLDCSTIDVDTRARGRGSGRQGPGRGRCAGLGRDRRGERRHADLHGRRFGRRRSARRADPRRWARP